MIRQHQAARSSAEEVDAQIKIDDFKQII